jgi:hypothetical protein
MAMRQWWYFGLLWMAAAITSCSDGTSPEYPSAAKVSFHGNSYLVNSTNVRARYDFGDSSLHYLSVSIITPDNPAFAFSFQAPDGDLDRLLTLGEHSGSGSLYDGIVCHFWDDNVDLVVFKRLGPDEYSLVWQTLTRSEDSFSGQGYVHLKSRIEYACLDSFRTPDGVFGPGDPAYDQYYDMYCMPEYYFPAQKIQFSCENIDTWW